jgi:OOP family OmpA-OmpF porin
MKKTVLAFAALAALASGSAFAQQAYVGGAVGQSHVNLDCSGVPNCTTNDTGYKVFGGYKFTPNLAGELTYFDWGKASGSSGAARAEVRGTGFGLGVAFMGDMAPQWSAVGRLGVATNKAKGEGTFNGAVVVSDSETKTTAYAGVGIGYAVTPQMTIDAALDFSNLELSGEKGNVRLFSVGVTFKF